MPEPDNTEKQRIRDILLRGANDPAIPNETYADAVIDAVISRDELENLRMLPERIAEILRLIDEMSRPIPGPIPNPTPEPEAEPESEPESEPEPEPEAKPEPEPEPQPEKWGCMDPKATNYDPDANFDDGSCLYSPEPEFKIVGVVKDGNTALVGAKLICKTSSIELTTSNEEGYYLFEFNSDGEIQNVKVTCSMHAYEPSEVEFSLNGSTTQADFKLTKISEVIPPSRSSICSKFDDKSFDVIIKGAIGGDFTDFVVKQCLGLNADELRKAKNQYQTNPPVIWDGEIPTLPARNTDHWLLGISASGKSAMLAGIIAYYQDRLIMESVKAQSVGVPYKNYLLNSMRNSCMPQDTPSVSVGDKPDAIFAYMPFNLQVPNSGGKIKPISLIEMAGEHVASLSKSDVNPLSKLDWVKSRNEKIMTLVYDVESSYPNQAQDLVECLNLFDGQGAFKRIIKIFLVVTKVDMLEEYGNGQFSYDEIKEKIRQRMEDREKSLINTINHVIDRNSSKNFWGQRRKIEFEILPMSVATELVKGKFIKQNDDRFMQEYAKRMEKGLLIRRK
jgi:hypothetical protein